MSTGTGSSGAIGFPETRHPIDLTWPRNGSGPCLSLIVNSPHEVGELGGACSSLTSPAAHSTLT